MRFSPVIDELIESLRALPGVGQKSAQRMALHLLERDRKGMQKLSAALAEAEDRVERCSRCNTFSEQVCCPICEDVSRDQTLLCIVESPSDLLAIEQAHHFQGLYFVLKGSLSPLDGRGPNEIGIPKLFERLDDSEAKEIILATNPTLEGEATAHYIAELCLDRDILVTRLAHGIPLGGELGYVDGGTLSHAFSGRKPVKND